MILKLGMVGWLVGCGLACAQDMRVVTEPKVPPVCVTLEARLSAVPDVNGGRLLEEDEGKLDTERIQKAMDGCGAGKAVELVMGSSCKSSDICLRNIAYTAFLSGPLDLREGVALVVDKGVTVYGSRDPGVFDLAKGEEPRLCGTSMPRPKELPLFSLNAAARPKGGCRALINVNGAKNTAVMGDGTLDGRGYAKLLGKDYSWWEMARRAQPNDDLYYSTKLVAGVKADGFVLYGIRLVNSANYHVTVAGTNGFTAWGVHLQTPVDKSLIGTGNDARNTDGIDPGTSENITVAHSWIDNGDDNIAVKQGVTHMSVLDNHFYSGHGMSIGSETVLGQSFLLVDGLTEDHTTSGIRIKSNVKRGGPVHDLVYRNICMREVPIPIAISPYYTNQTVEPFEDPKYEGDKVPEYKRIRLENIYSETAGDVLIAGLDEAHRTGISVDAVHIEGITPEQVHLKYTQLDAQSCTAFPMSPHTNWLQGPFDGTVRFGVPQRSGCGAMALHPPDPCAGKFVPMR